MNSNINQEGQEFKSPDEAFEYLVNQQMDEKRRKEWTKAFGTSKDEDSSQKSTIMRRLYIRLVSAAAVLLIVAGVFMFFQQKKSVDQIASLLITDTQIAMNYGSGSRGENKGVEEAELKSLKNSITSVLLEGNYEIAIDYFEVMENKYTLSIEDKYFFAASIVKLNTGDYPKAISLLSEVIENGEQHLENALWLRALALGKLKETQRMKQDLIQYRLHSSKNDETINQLLTDY